MEKLLEQQKARYIEACSRLRVERSMNKLNDLEYQEELLSLGRKCQDFLLTDIEKHVDMFKEIKRRTDELKQELGVI